MNKIISILLIATAFLASCAKEASFEQIEPGVKILMNGTPWAPLRYSIDSYSFQVSDDRYFNPVDSTWHNGRVLEVYLPSNTVFENDEPKAFDDVFARLLPEGDRQSAANYDRFVQGRVEFWKINTEAVVGRFEMTLQRASDGDVLLIEGNFKIPR